jgi:5'(3')-deoxyribonucleotidase
MAEARLSFKELSITILIQYFPFLKWIHILRKGKKNCIKIVIL